MGFKQNFPNSINRITKKVAGGCEASYCEEKIDKRYIALIKNWYLHVFLHFQLQADHEWKRVGDCDEK